MESKVHDSMASNKKEIEFLENMFQPKQPPSKKIDALANVFENIDPTKDLEETVSKINQSRFEESFNEQEDDLQIQFSAREKPKKELEAIEKEQAYKQLQEDLRKKKEVYFKSKKNESFTNESYDDESAR